MVLFSPGNFVIGHLPGRTFGLFHWSVRILDPIPDLQTDRWDDGHNRHHLWSISKQIHHWNHLLGIGGHSCPSCLHEELDKMSSSRSLITSYFLPLLTHSQKTDMIIPDKHVKMGMSFFMCVVIVVIWNLLQEH